MLLLTVFYYLIQNKREKKGLGDYLSLSSILSSSSFDIFSLIISMSSSLLTS